MSNKFSNNSNYISVDDNDGINDSLLCLDNVSHMSKVIEQFNTGDIILFGSHNYIVSKIIEWYCGSKWSHIGIVLKDPYDIDPSLKGYYLLQSTFGVFPDSLSGIKEYGVQIVPLEETLQNYRGYISARKLENLSDKMRDGINRKLAGIFITIRDKPYDLSIIDFLCLGVKIDKPEKQSKYPLINYIFGLNESGHKTDKFICSGLVAYVYTELGLLNYYFKWDECMPKYFSEENSLLYLNDDCRLSDEIVIK